MTQPYVTGPAPVWIGLGGGAGFGFTPVFLGHAERTPAIKFRPRYSNLFVDLGGQEIPFDVVKQGTDAMVSIDMTRFNEFNYQVAVGIQGSHPGSIFGSLGTLMMTENIAYPLWIPFPYSVIHPAMATQVAGYHFFRAICMNDDIDQMGTVPRRQRLIWHCIRDFNPIDYSFTLCDNDMLALPPSPFPGAPLGAYGG